MPHIDIDNLEPLHAERLRWFLDREDETTGFPAPLRDDIHLSSRPKGIFKPRELPYALSIRINLESPYSDGDVYDRDDGTIASADLSAVARRNVVRAAAARGMFGVATEVSGERHQLEGEADRRLL